MKQITNLLVFFVLSSITLISCTEYKTNSSEATSDSTSIAPESVGTISQSEYMKLLPPEYAQREESASTEVKQRLQQERETIANKGFNFIVVNTSVSEMSLKDITGAFPISKKVSDSLVNAMKSRHLPPTVENKSTARVSPTDISYDPRIYNLTPDIRLQKCGDCWAYSAIGPLEISYIKIHGIAAKTIDLSEKQMLTCSNAGTCDGGWPYLVYSYLAKQNNNIAVMDESKLPDDGVDHPCPTINPSAKVKLAYWGIVDVNNGFYRIGNRDKIKEAIVNYGAVSACILATPTFQDFGSSIDGTGVFKEEVSNENDPQINHAIIIIGWDDNKNAWLIRNSWSSGWGNKGYAWVDYNTNNIGYGAIWCVAK